MVFSGRLELKFKAKLDDATYKSGVFDTAGKLIMGTSNGKIVVYNLEQGKIEGEPVRIGGVE